MALILVLLIICITLGLSYAAVRSQFTGLKIQRNADRRISARQAAATGLTMAIKEMHTAGWKGVDTTLTGSLGSNQGFQVTYSTGDPSLGPEHPDYEDFPYRVTLLSTGSAADPDNPASVATHQIRAVVRLIPRALADEPADWAEITKYTLYQYQEAAFEVNVPFRAEGAVRVQKELTLGKEYTWKKHMRFRYLSDLNAMRSAEYPDWRPFDGPLHLPRDKQEPGLWDLLTTTMRVPTEDSPKDVPSDWNHPGELSSYQIYPGGKVYDVLVLGQNYQDVTLEPDPETNPLGIYYRSGEVQLYNNVTIRGTLVARATEGDVHIYGKNVHLLPHNLPALEGSDQPVQLPVAVVQDDLRIHADAEGKLNGLLLIWDDFEIHQDWQYDIAVEIQSRIVAKDFRIRGRFGWIKWSDWWEEKYDEFVEQEDEDGGIRHFPIWLRNECGFDPDPRLTIKPDPTPVRYHWHNPQNPIYVPRHPEDYKDSNDPNSGFLRWELLQWTENP